MAYPDHFLPAETDDEDDDEDEDDDRPENRRGYGEGGFGMVDDD